MLRVMMSSGDPEVDTLMDLIVLGCLGVRGALWVLEILDVARVLEQTSVEDGRRKRTLRGRRLSPNSGSVEDEGFTSSTKYGDEESVT